MKFLAGINHNTPFVFMHDINIMFDINSLQGIALSRFDTFVQIGHDHTTTIWSHPIVVR